MVTGKTVSLISTLLHQGWGHKVQLSGMYCVDTLHSGTSVIEICTLVSRKVNDRQQSERFLSAYATSMEGEMEIKTLKELEAWVTAQAE